MEKQKLEILNMVKDGTITPEEALKLLDAINQENVKFVFADKAEKTSKSEDRQKGVYGRVMDLVDSLGVKPKKDEPTNVKIITEIEAEADDAVTLTKKTANESLDKKIIEAVRNSVSALLKNNFSGHGIDHIMRVYKNAAFIAEDENCNILHVKLAALLHDADDHKLFNTEHNANARQILKDNGLSEDKIDDICKIISSVSFTENKDKKLDSIEGKIVQDADRLDAIGAIGIARTFAYAGAHARDLKNTVKHFDEKLLLLKERMNTQRAKELAEKRHKFMEEFLNELDQEINMEKT